MRIHQVITIALLMVTVSSCQNDRQEDVSIGEMTHQSEVSQEETDTVKVDSDVMTSIDSSYEIRVYKTAVKMNNGSYPMAADTLQYTCLELSRVDSSRLGFKTYQTTSPSAPEYYLTLTVKDSNYVVASSWHFCESTVDSYKFYFPFDAFDEFDNSAEIKLIYPGPHVERPLVVFKPLNFKKVITGLVPPHSTARCADIKWFKSHGFSVLGKSNL